MFEILRQAAAEHEVTVADILSASRSRSVVAARWAVWRALTGRGWSRAAIARAFGVDWSSVHNALRSQA